MADDPHGTKKGKKRVKTPVQKKGGVRFEGKNP